jgi:hypothetical protein
MAVMAKERRPKVEPEPDPDNERRTINFRIVEDDLWDALEAFRASHRYPPKKTQTMIDALKHFLAAEGYYPPKAR